MIDNRYTNMWGETPEEQEKRREWLRGVYDRATKPEQTPLQGNDNGSSFGQVAQSNNNPENTDKPNPSWLDKAAYASNGAIQGLSFGFADEIEGAMGGLGYGLASLNSDWNKRGESFWDAAKRGYVQTRDARRNHLQEGYENAPVITRTAEAIGAIASPLNKIGEVSQFAPRSVQAAQEVKNAVRGGTIYGAGSGQGDVGDQLQNMVVGGASSLVGNKFAQTMRPAINSLFMNQTGRNLAKNATENVIGNTAQYGVNQLEDYWKRRF